MTAFPGAAHVPRHLESPYPTQRAGERLRARIAGAGEPEEETRGNVRRKNRDPAGHRRQGRAHQQARAFGDAASARACARRFPPGRRIGSADGDPRRGPCAEGLGEPAVGSARGGVPESRRVAAGSVPRCVECIDDARPEQDLPPGRDRQRVRADRLLPLQRRVLRTIAARAAAEFARHLEPPRTSPARRLRVRGFAVQLHLDRRQPADRARAVRQYGDLEAGEHRRLQRAFLDETVQGSRPARRRDQPRHRQRRRHRQSGAG